VTTKQVPRVVAERKKWKKFGAAENDGTGPNVATTFLSDEIPLQFTQTQLEAELTDDKRLDPMRGPTEASAGRCRFCKVDGHWSHSCPYKVCLISSLCENNMQSP
jgi:translation initiation factor 3 subunit G